MKNSAHTVLLIFQYVTFLNFKNVSAFSFKILCYFLKRLFLTINIIDTNKYTYIHTPTYIGYIQTYKRAHMCTHTHTHTK